MKAVLFDLDNTLTHRAQSIERYASVFMRHFRDDMEAVDIATVIKLLQEQDNGGYLAAGSPYATIQEAVANTVAEQLPWHERPGLRCLVNHWRKHFPASAVPMAGAEALIQSLSSQGLALAIISNGADGSRKETLQALPFAKSFQFLLSSEAAGIAKPTPEIFLQAAAKLNLQPADCLYVGDHPVNDYQGARNVGMNAIWLAGFHEWPAGQEKPRTASSLSELEQLLTASDTETR